jgi:hypothetical protein
MNICFLDSNTCTLFNGGICAADIPILKSIPLRILNSHENVKITVEHNKFYDVNYFFILTTIFSAAKWPLSGQE